MEDRGDKILTEILQRMVRVETKIDGVIERQSEDRDKADEALSLAKDAGGSVRSAHRRLNKIDKVLFWISTTVIGSIVLSVIASIMIK